MRAGMCSVRMPVLSLIVRALLQVAFVCACARVYVCMSAYVHVCDCQVQVC